MGKQSGILADLSVAIMARVSAADVRRMMAAWMAAGWLLASGPAMAQTTGKNPSHEDILRGFDAAALWASREDVGYGGTYIPTGMIVKWDKPIVYRLDGMTHKPAMRDYAVKALQKQAAIAGLEVREATAYDPANYTIVFGDVDVFVMANGRKAGCYMRPIYDYRSGKMISAELRINLSSRDVERCIVHEVLHGFGLLNHPHKLHSVLSYYTVAFVFDLTEPDEVLLRTLYDPRIKAGMSRLPALLAADGIIEEKRRALNPAAPPKTDAAAVIANAVTDLEKAAAAGNVRAMLHLAEAARHGHGMPKDRHRMAALLDRAAGQADPAQRFDLAYALAFGWFVPKDEARAAAIYRLNAEAGHASSQNNLAVLLRDGKGVAEDKIEALMWFTLAARGNLAVAEQNRQKLLPMLDAAAQQDAARRIEAWKPAGQGAK